MDSGRGEFHGNDYLVEKYRKRLSRAREIASSLTSENEALQAKLTEAEEEQERLRGFIAKVAGDCADCGTEKSLKAEIKKFESIAERHKENYHAMQRYCTSIEQKLKASEEERERPPCAYIPQEIHNMKFNDLALRYLELKGRK